MGNQIKHIVLLLMLAVFQVVRTLNNPSKRSSKPNIVMILTDDQDLHLNSLDRMDNVQKQLIEKGTFFNHHYAHVAQCCPSRATLWTGKHAHNTNVTGIYNDMSGGGWEQVVKQGLHKKHLGVWMQKAGYNTYYSGKIYNGYNHDNFCDPECIQGWSNADMMLGPYTYYYYKTKYGHFDGLGWTKTEPEGYSTDQVADNVAYFIEQASKLDDPFFAVAAPVAPHIPTKPKDEYKDLYADLELPRSPNFNPENRTGVGPVWNLDRLSQDEIDKLTEKYRARQQCLKSVDDLVQTIVKKLEDVGELGNTYIFYTTDNGYHMGNHRLKGGKLQCFEEDINVPMIIRGPDVGQNMTTDLVSGHIDVAPTMLAIAGYGDEATWPETDVVLDGTPIQIPLKTREDIERNDNARGETTHLEFWGTFHQEWAGSKRAEGGPDMVNTYKALRLQGPNYSLLYSVWCMNSAHELYDMTWDPYQMTNLHPGAPVDGNGTNAYTSGMRTMLGRPIDILVHRLDALVLVLSTCVGETCRWPWKQLHANGKVNTLMDALDEQYDNFYATTYAMAKVGWEDCYSAFTHKGNKKFPGPDATLYNLYNEQPSWNNSTVVYMLTGRGQAESGSSRLALSANLVAWLFACVIFLAYR